MPLGMSEAAGNLAEFAAGVMAQPLSRNHTADLRLSPSERAVVVGLTDLDVELKERLDVRSKGVKSFSFTLYDLARICLALSVGLLDAQDRDFVKMLSLAGKVTDRLDHAVGELANAPKSRRADSKDQKSRPKESTGR